MAHLVNTPQFQVPFHLHNGEVAVVEQDSAEDRTQNATTVMRYTKGQRTAIPEFGVPDFAMRQDGMNADELTQAVLTWEPDVDVEVVKEIIESGVETAEVEITAVDDQPGHYAHDHYGA